MQAVGKDYRVPHDWRKARFSACDNLQFKTAGESLTAPIAGVFDITSLLPADAPHLDGSLGLDIFAGRAITFDESSQVLIMT
jgi:hypothetical protein